MLEGPARKSPFPRPDVDLEHEKYAQLIVEVADREAVIALLS